MLFGKKPEVVVEAGGREQWVTRFGLVMAIAQATLWVSAISCVSRQGCCPTAGPSLNPLFPGAGADGHPADVGRVDHQHHGGGYGHGSTPGMFHRLWKHPASKYLGIFGVLLPFIVGLYYVYIESWTLGYAWQTMTGILLGPRNPRRDGQRVRWLSRDRGLAPAVLTRRHDAGVYAASLSLLSDHVCDQLHRVFIAAFRKGSRLSPNTPCPR